MNQLILMGLILIGSLPLSAVLLKLIFKKSFLTNVFIAITGYVSLSIFLGFTGGNLGIRSMLWIIPSLYGSGLVMYLLIKNNVQKPLEDSISRLSKVSKGDLTILVKKSKKKDELGNLNNAVNNLVGSLQSIIADINESAANLLSASNQVSSTSQQISQGANEQASSVEEVSSTMEQIAANIEQNTSNAQQTEKISSEANDGIQVVAQRASNTVEANKNIADKISIVSDIAFQTNILALNAAVEAARAGEHGKGFAVVAAEVRKLAERSKVAAEEIVALANESLELAQGAGEVMMDTIPKIENTTRLVQEISAASNEQNNGASQVNGAMQQLNSVTQQNASASEELASSAEEMSTQAEQLKELIAFFKLDNTNQSAFSQKKSFSNIKSEQTKINQNTKKMAVLDLSGNGGNDNEFEGF